MALALLRVFVAAHGQTRGPNIMRTREVDWKDICFSRGRAGAVPCRPPHSYRRYFFSNHTRFVNPVERHRRRCGGKKVRTVTAVQRERALGFLVPPRDFVHQIRCERWCHKIHVLLLMAYRSLMDPDSRFYACRIDGGNYVSNFQ
ncbi:unnamed protein product [Ectocarpus sp. 8 AP-2014]